jgi:predicted MFS family arabinose efflux permease
MAPDLLRNREVLWGCLASALVFFAMIGGAVMLPLALQAVAGNPPDQVALKMLMHALAVPFGAFFSGRMMPRTMRFRRNMVAGAVLGCLCAALLAWLRFESPLAVGAAMLGMGLGSHCAATRVVAVQVAVAHARIGAVTALLGLARSLGSAMGLAILTSVLFSTIGVAGGSSAAMLVKRIGPADLTLVHGFTMVFVCVAVALPCRRLAACSCRRPHRPAN